MSRARHWWRRRACWAPLPDEAAPWILALCVASPASMRWRCSDLAHRHPARAGGAGGLALLNSFANLGGYFGPDLDGAGRSRRKTGDYTLGLSLLAGMETVAAVSVIRIGRRSPRTPPRCGAAGAENGLLSNVGQKGNHPAKHFQE